MDIPWHPELLTDLSRNLSIIARHYGNPHLACLLLVTRGILDTLRELKIDERIIVYIPWLEVPVLSIIVSISHEQLWSDQNDLLVQDVNLAVVESALVDHRSSNIAENIFGYLLSA